jgi:LmbE family N-acetylglucosaminyl deacetylase
VKHVYLSPHLDDAVLSCGGAIHRTTAAGEEVLVVTVFAEEAGADMVLSPFALAQHGYWGNPPKPMTLRRAEDAAALALLGAEGLYLGYLDAVYRTDASGQSIYTDLETLMGEVHPADPTIEDGAEGLAGRLAGIVSARDQAVLYAPLGVGHHVDHQIVHAAARRLLARGYRLAFYADYPYAEQPGAVEAALAFARAEGWRTEIITLDPADVTAKVCALSYYRSQLPTLFGGVEAMPNRVWAFAAVHPPQPGTRLAERLWWPR